MEKLLLVAVVCAWSVGLAGVLRAADATLELTVRAGDRDRAGNPISVLVDAPAAAKAVVLTDADGNKIPGQLTAPGLKNRAAKGKSELHFILPRLAKGESLKLAARFSSEPASGGFAWQEVPEQYAELSFDGRPVMRYMCLKLTPENRDEAFKVYHHLYNPAGTRLVTKGSGSRYTHHRGLFFGYCKVTYEGGKADTWSGRNTPETHGGYLASDAGPVLGRHLVQVDWQGSEGDVYLKEERELSVYNVPGGTLVDFTSHSATTGGPIKLDGNAPHAGFQFRAAAEVAEETEKETYYLRPDGRGEPGAAVASAYDLPWDAISFVIDEKRYTVVYLDRPDNPKPAEYNERTYGRFGSFFRYDLEKGKDLDVSYRIWLQDGEMTVDEAAALSDDFVHPPEVVVD
jgi:hypothetical protein